MAHTLYLCYFGLNEPLVQTQVLPYLRELKKLTGLKVSLLTFEPKLKENWTLEKVEAAKAKLAGEGVDWHALSYHKRPSVPATLYDIFCGALFAIRLARREKIDIFHARSHIPAMMAAIAKRFSRAKMIFDIRGFLPEEYTDAGVWKEGGIIFKTVKYVEKKLLARSDGFVVLTEKARDVLFPESRENGFERKGRPVEVIPCCIEPERFESAADDSSRRELGLENRFVVAHVGSLGGLYMTEEIADLYAAARAKKEETFALILTQSDPESIAPLLKLSGFSEKDFLIEKVSPGEVPNYLAASDAGLSLVKATFATVSRSPTKIPEYLACGLPVIANSGVGDVDEQIREDRVGVIIEEFSAISYTQAIREIEEMQRAGDLAKRCKNSATKRFDMEKIGGERYRRLYRRVLESK